MEMKKRKQGKNLINDLEVRFVKVLDLLLATISFATIWYGFYADKLHVRFAMRGHWLVIALFAFLFVLFGKVYDAFDFSRNRVQDMVFEHGLALLEADFVMYIVAFLLIRHVPLVWPMFLCLGMQLIYALFWCYLAQKWFYETFAPREAIIVYGNREDVQEWEKNFQTIDKYHIKEVLKIDEVIHNLSKIKDIDTIFVLGVHSRDRNALAKYCVTHEIQMFMVPRVGDLLLAGAMQKHVFHVLMLNVERHYPMMEYAIVKRLSDIILSAVALIILSPVILITAICIKAEDHGPVFYKQVRVTKDGKEFEILKFRSMKVDAESDHVARLSSGKDDDRVTKVGRSIRKVRIDEIPQFINVLKGDLSLVGPRPERPELIEKYKETIPEFDLRLQVKAGITGYAQVYGKYNTTPYDKLLMDLMYISNASVFEDIRIMLATVSILFLPESTEGVAVGATTAMDYENAADSIENNAETVAK